MPDTTSNADEATLYVLGLLNERERRDFEVRMANSRELRATVRALETGVLALTMAAPRREPPPKVWENIQTTILQESQRNIVAVLFHSAWFRSAMAAAACAVLGWYLHALWADRPVSRLARSVDDALAPGTPERSAATSSSTDAHGSSKQPDTSSNSLPSTPPWLASGTASPAEAAALRRRIAELETQMGHLNQALTQHQTLPPELSRLTFFNLSPTGAVAGTGKTSRPSSELQRALLLGLARELGWLAPPANGVEAQEQKTEDGPPTVTPRSAETAVEFVDLRPTGTEGPRRPISLPPEEHPPIDTAAENSSSAIPAFAGRSNLTFAINPEVTDGKPITIWMASATGNGQPVSLGSVAVGVGPTVVTVPWGSSPAGTHVTITAGSTVIGQFSSGGSTPP